MKESFDFGNPRDISLGPWPKEEQMPRFRHDATEFYQVYVYTSNIDYRF